MPRRSRRSRRAPRESTHPPTDDHWVRTEFYIFYEMYKKLNASLIRRTAAVDDDHMTEPAAEPAVDDDHMAELATEPAAGLHNIATQEEGPRGCKGFMEAFPVLSIGVG